MLKAKDGDFFISDWLRNRNTLEYIGTWEKVYNPKFNFDEFNLITNRSGFNSFKISVKEFVERTNAISIVAKAGRYGEVRKMDNQHRINKKVPASIINVKAKRSEQFR